MKKFVFWILLIGNIIISVIMPAFVFPKCSLELSDFENIMSVFLGIIVLFTLEIYIYVNIMYQSNKEEQEIYQLDSNSDKKLFNIMQLVKVINHNSFEGNDLFRFYINKKIDDLYNLVSDACNKHEIKIEDTMIEITNEMYASAFIGDKESIFRPMYLCSDNDFFFESFGKSYFEIAYKLTRNRKCKTIKRLFVYNDDVELEDERVKKLIYFHNTTSSYACKTLKQDVYDRIKDDFGLNYVTGSFAVYGSRYLYTERTAQMVGHVIGYYSKDKDNILKFINFFERCWQQATVYNISSNKKISVANVFDEGWNL